jgi:hypothetical protein
MHTWLRSCSGTRLHKLWRDRACDDIGGCLSKDSQMKRAMVRIFVRILRTELRSSVRGFSSLCQR